MTRRQTARRRPPARPAYRRPPARSRAPSTYPRRGRGRQPKTFGEQASAGTVAEIRRAVRSLIAVVVVLVTVLLMLAVSCVGRVTGWMPEPSAPTPPAAGRRQSLTAASSARPRTTSPARSRHGPRTG